MTIVSIGTTSELRGQLDTLAAAAGLGRGQVVEATELDEVARRFEEAGRAIAQQVVVTAPVTTDLFGRPISIAVSARADDGSTIEATRPTSCQPHRPCQQATEPADYGPRPVALPSYPIGQEILPVALVAIFAGAATILAVALMAAVRTDTAQGRISRRLSLYTLAGRQPQKQAETTSTSVFGSSAIARSAVELAGRVVAEPRLESALAARLDSAGLLLKPAEWTLIQIASGLLAALLLLLLSGRQHPRRSAWPSARRRRSRSSISSSRRSRREDAFLAQLPETLQLMAGSLSVGYSLSQAVDTVVREGSQPVSGEFNRALVQARLGMPVEDALEAVAGRFRSNDMTGPSWPSAFSARLAATSRRFCQKSREPCESANGCTVRSACCPPKDGSPPGSSGRSTGGVHAVSRSGASGVPAPTVHHTAGLASHHRWRVSSSWLACSGFARSSRCEV